MVELILYIALFLCLSGVMAMVDAAVLSISAAEIEVMVARGRFGSASLKKLHARLTRAVVVIVILTNTTNVLGPVLVGSKAVQLYGTLALGVVTAALTFATVIFSEIIPKSVGVHYAPVISRLAAPAIRLLGLAIYPVVVALDAVSGLFRKGHRPIGTEAQIRSLVNIGSRAGHIEKDESQIIQRTFVLNDKTAADIMIPRRRIASLAADTPIGTAASKMLRRKYSRYPVLSGPEGEVQGLVITQDVLAAFAQGREQRPVGSIAREILKVESTEALDELLLLFRNRRTHMAIVMASGKALGLVTMEDVLEELVGEIEDEKGV